METALWKGTPSQDLLVADRAWASVTYTPLGESLEVDREGTEKVEDCYVPGPSQARPWPGDICKDCC